jgi:hypothetical protein
MNPEVLSFLFEDRPLRAGGITLGGGRSDAGATSNPAANASNGDSCSTATTVIASTCSTATASTAAASPTMNYGGMEFSQAMVSSFSMDVSSYSSDLFEYPATTAGRARAELRNAFVVCWENVLVPAKWMSQRLGLKPTPRALQEAKDRAMRDSYLHATLAAIEQRMMMFINAVAERGPVYIVSEESVQFVEAMCKAFFPRLAYCLCSATVMTNVFVIGAPQRFQSVNEKTAWRVSLLQSLCRDRLFGGSIHLLNDREAGRFGLVVVSPHMVDAFACTKTVELAPFVVPKSVQVQNARGLSLEQFALHLLTLTQYISQAAPCETPFAVAL